MPLPVVVSFAAAYFSLILAAVSLLRDRSSSLRRIFVTGMLLLSLEERCRGLGYRAILPQDVIYWQKRLLGVSTLTPGIWLLFSVTYGRSSAFFQLRSKWWWVGLITAPFLFFLIFRQSLFAGAIVLQ